MITLIHFFCAECGEFSGFVGQGVQCLDGDSVSDTDTMLMIHTDTDTRLINHTNTDTNTYTYTGLMTHTDTK